MTPDRVAALVAAVLAAALLATWAVGSGSAMEVATRGVTFAVAAVSLQFMLGFGGLVSFGQAAVVGIGAYAVLALDGVDAALVLPLAMATAAAFAGLTGLVSLRTQGVTYIMITLAFGQMAFFVAQAWAPLGGDDGMSLGGRSPVLGTALLGGRRAFLAVAVGCLVGVGILPVGVGAVAVRAGLAGLGGERGAGGGLGIRRHAAAAGSLGGGGARGADWPGSCWRTARSSSARRCWIGAGPGS